MTNSVPTPAWVFWVVERPSLAITVLLPVTLAVWLYLTRSDPSQIDGVAGAALLLQMFAASAGYRDRLLRGHFDAVLLVPSSRMRVAWAHWIVATAPGLATWMAIGLVDLWARPGRVPTALTPPGLLAFAWVSAAAWAVSLPTRQYAGGGLWLVGLFSMAATHQLIGLRSAFALAGDGWMDSLRAAGAALACPILLLSDHSGGRTQAFVGLAAFVAFVGGSVFIGRVDAPLQDSL